MTTSTNVTPKTNWVINGTDNELDYGVKPDLSTACTIKVIGELPADSTGLFESTVATIIDLTNATSEHVFTLVNAFRGAAVTSLDLSNLDTSKVTNMDSMCALMPEVTTVIMDNMNLQSVNSVFAIFDGSRKLNRVSMKGVDVSNIEDFRYMVYGCTGLHDFDISNFKFSYDAHLDSMLFGTVRLANLDYNVFPADRLGDLYAIGAGDPQLSEKVVDVSALMGKVINVAVKYPLVFAASDASSIKDGVAKYPNTCKPEILDAALTGLDCIDKYKFKSQDCNVFTEALLNELKSATEC